MLNEVQCSDVRDRNNQHSSISSMLSHLSSPPPPLPVAAHPRLISLPPFISCWVDEWVTNMDQTQTRQTAAPPSHPSLCLFLICPSWLSCLYLCPSHHIFPSLSFSLLTLILSILCLLNGWSTCWKWKWKKGGVRQHKEKELNWTIVPKKIEWKYKYIFFSEVIIFLYLYPLYIKTKQNIPIL